jgi:hypothetical protein
MGNIISNKNKDDDINNIIEEIASNYILSQNFKDMEMLTTPDKCDKLIVLTSNVFKDNLSLKQLTNLDSKIKGVASNTHAITTQQLLDQQSKIGDNEKELICKSVAKYYIKIAHTFAAIMLAINPKYTYLNSEGEPIEVSLFEKYNIPDGVKLDISPSFGFCNERINALVGKSNILDITDVSTKVNIEPDICNANNDFKTLNDVYGIPELKHLYYDKYNMETGKFDNMTDYNANLYSADLKLFYKTFTGKKDMPVDITSFDRIPLADYNESALCKSNNSSLHVSDSLKNEMFVKYASHIRKMMNHLEINKTKLLGIINDLFIVDGNNTKIKSGLNENKLDKIIKKTREHLVKMYILCEKQYKQGLEIFDAIAEKLILDNTQKQIGELKQLIHSNLAD